MPVWYDKFKYRTNDPPVSVDSLQTKQSDIDLHSLPAGGHRPENREWFAHNWKVSKGI